MKRTQSDRIGLIILAGGALFFLAACGGGGKAAVSLQDESAQAQSLATEIDADQNVADFEEDTRDLTGEEEADGQSNGLEMAPPAIAFAASLAREQGLVFPRPFFPAALLPRGEIQKDEVEIDYYACGATDNRLCRIKDVTVPLLFPKRHWLEAAEVKTTSALVYSSALTGAAGDLDLTSRYTPRLPNLSGPAAYVSAEFQVIRDLREETTQLTSTGTGVYSEDPDNPYYEFAWSTTGFPASAKVCREDVIEPTQVDDYLYSDLKTRIRETTKTFPDGVTAYHHRSVIRENGVIYTDSFRLNRRGGTLSIQAVIDPGTTPRCPLDDTGTINVTRVFSVENDLPEGVTVPVREITVIDKQGLTENVSSTLTLSNGQTLTRTLQREVQSPVSCTEWEAASPKPAIVVHVTGQLYRGGTLDLTVTRDELGLSVTGTRTQPDGISTEIEITRYRGSEGTEIKAERHDPDQTLQAEVTINLRGNQQGRGQITVYSEDGDTKEIMLKFTCDGKGYWYPSDNPSDKHEFGKEKFLKYGLEKYL